MINTFYLMGNLDSAKAFLAALAIGCAFGFFLERAGFGSSKKLASVFYFTDMTVIKVMFTAVITAMLGLAYLISLGLFQEQSMYLLPTVYGAQIAGGLIFGIGFVMGGWCPGTAAAGLANGKIDALVFMIGAVLGSMIFNELFVLVKPLYTMGQAGVLFVYDSLSISKSAFVFIFCLAGIVCFWLCEYVEKIKSQTEIYFRSSFLKAFSLAVLAIAAGLSILPQTTGAAKLFTVSEVTLMQDIDNAKDHIEPEELADRLANGDTGLILVDIRPANEFASFQIKGSVNVPLLNLQEYLLLYKNIDTIVLYSNGMTHPAQARDSLYRSGFNNVYILTDGLNGFIERCLKPASLRKAPLSEQDALRVNQWRQYFLVSNPESSAIESAEQISESIHLSRLVETDWLAENLGKSGIVIIDFRSQPEYSTSHIPGSLFLNMESLRGNVGGVGSMLLPADLLARYFSLMSIKTSDMVILVHGDKVQDATLAVIAFERLGHKNYAVLNGGFSKWVSEAKLTNAELPVITESAYPLNKQPDYFTVGYKDVFESLNKKDAIIIDVRPADYYTGQKSDEARPGHIPGAINRPFTEDIIKGEKFQSLKSIEDLEKAYSAIIPSKQSKVIIHCRTGHQASQTFFILKKLLGYENVYWYDGGWSQWAARSELPVEVTK